MFFQHNKFYHWSRMGILNIDC